MKKIISFVTLFAFFQLNVSNVFAQEKQPKDIPGVLQHLSPEPAKVDVDVGAALSPLKKLQAAPFAGVLLSPLAIATLIADINARKEETQIEVDRATSKLQANFDYDKSVLMNKCDADTKVYKAQLDHKQNEIKALTKALEEQDKQKQDPLVWAFIGLATGIVSATVTASVITAVSK